MSQAQNDRSTNRGRSPHAPSRGWASRLLGPLHVTGVFWFRALHFAAKSFPDWMKAPLVLIFTSFFFVVLRRIRRAVAANLKAVLGPCGPWARERRIFRTLRAHAWCLVERYERLAGLEGFEVALEGREHWQELEQSSDGFVLVTAHLGPWETASFAATTDQPRQVHVVREGELDPRAQELNRQLLGEHEGASYKIHFAGDEKNLGTALLFALRRGEIVALQGDRPAAEGRTATVELFGRPLTLPAGPALLAATAGVPLLLSFAYREGRRRTRIIFRPPLEANSDSNRQTTAEATMQAVAAEIEQAIRRDPHQWFCFRQLWED